MIFITAISFKSGPKSFLFLVKQNRSHSIKNIGKAARMYNVFTGIPNTRLVSPKPLPIKSQKLLPLMRPLGIFF